MSDPQRVIVYIDGFNLYYGLKDANLKRLLWLNLRALCLKFLQPGQTLSKVNYFTARVSDTAWDQNKSHRQNTFLEAVATQPDVEMYFGKYLSKPVRCNRCGNEWQKFEEKMTDVNIAVQLLTDAYGDAFDVAILVSGDSDLVGPIQQIRLFSTNKKVIVAFPPRRNSEDLKKAANAYFRIGKRKLAQSQFEESVKKADGFVLQRPAKWK